MDLIKFDETLIDPAVAASILYHDSVLYFTNPKNTTHRKYEICTDGVGHRIDPPLVF